MAITNFVPTIWSSTLLSILRKSLVYGGPLVSNREYEGEIAAAGATVNITSVADVAVSNYTKDTDMTVSTLTDAMRQLVITEQKYFDFEVDDIDFRQSVDGGALMSEAASRAGFNLGDVADQYIAAAMNAGGTGVGAVSISPSTTNNTDVYNKLLVPMRVALGKRNVPTQGRFIVISPDLMGQLLLDGRFIKFDEAGPESALYNGAVGRAAGFTILESNNTPASAATVAVTDCVTSTSAAPTAVAGTTMPFAGPLTAGTLVTSASNAFTQRMVGAKITGTGIPTSTTVVYVYAGGGSAVLSAAATASATVTATVGTANGVANQVGLGQGIVAGVNMGFTFAEQISKVEAFRPEKRFADALKGLHVYGGKVVRPEALAVADVFITT